MTNDLLIQKIQSIQPEAESKTGFEYVETFIPLDKQHDFLLELKNNPELAFDYLFCQTGADFTDHLQVIYHLESTTHQHCLVVKVKTTDRINPVVESVNDIWPTAESHENEIFDLLGITFKNHPEPRRLFLDENWGFPLRKDYQDDVHIITR